MSRTTKTRNKSAPIAGEGNNKFLNTAGRIGLAYNYPLADIVSVFGELQCVLSRTKKQRYGMQTELQGF